MVKKQFCFKGHNKDIVGQYKDGKCKLCHIERMKKRYIDNKESWLEYQRRYQQQYDQNNKNKIREKNRKYYKKYNLDRYQNDIEFKLKSRLRSRLSNAIKIGQKSGSAVRDLGCSIQEFKQYIESKFYGNMTWSNHGVYWHIDHVVPLNSFDLTDRDQLLKACNYMNLQPLTIEDHDKKTAVDSYK